MPDKALALPGQSFGAAPLPPPKRGLFGGSRPEPGPSPEVTGMTEQINALAARIRVSEERLNELRKKLMFIEQNMLTNHKKALTDVKLTKDEVDEVRHKLVDVEDRVITIIKELRLTARKSDIDVLRRYIELWDPVKFVTADHVEKIVRDILEQPTTMLPETEEKQNI